MTAAKQIPADADLYRGQDALKCECGGHAESVETTSEERATFGCGRSYQCCDVAFVCVLCGQRYAGRQPSPDVDYD